MVFDQLFTAENFRRIYDSENRKGSDLATRFFPTLEPYTIAVRDKVKEIRELRKIEAALTVADFEAKLLAMKAELVALKTAKSDAVDVLMDEISQKILKPSFKIRLSQKTGPKRKPVFCVDAEPETFFVIKQLQVNIHYIYDVKQAGRHDLACQLRDMLSSKFPFELVRTDISSFYESIDRKLLIEKLDRDQLLSSASRKYIKQVLSSYGDVSGTTVGIPRGVGISAYLSELYLKPVDTAIRALPGLVLYCRFVDDIVAIFARPPTGQNLGSFKDLIIGIFGRNGLTHNLDKTREFQLADASPKKFEYLGYRFLVKSGKVEISPSAAKVLKYRARMNAAFLDYWRENPTNPKSAFKNLVARMKFLTGNTRLANSKAFAVTGIYFNNSITTDLSSFKLLDKQLNRSTKKLKRTSLQKKLKNFKFSSGFEQRQYHNFSTRELKMIVQAWKHD
ncbi:antiviral reverse transcriptase Drt3a [Variovorax sp. N23]|uniref:antiviral reverse transcriptase Drt3a n=1 Tax=Variovorax sp. N23 TaxID=2980555 RepID=UPI0021CA3761|nr:antiviral reverse transcriptase Drt3a [Variovorax sp. N23]MCU4121982.1 RNA-directed DNA polymerase [Variovorax sp. N23]